MILLVNLALKRDSRKVVRIRNYKNNKHDPNNNKILS